MPALAGRGRKVDDAVAPYAIEAQLVIGQISPLKRPDGSGLVLGKAQGDYVSHPAPWKPLHGFAA